MCLDVKSVTVASLYHLKPALINEADNLSSFSQGIPLTLPIQQSTVEDKIFISQI